ncbi:FAD-dependent oxidoreductase [Microbispora rosea]
MDIPAPADRTHLECEVLVVGGGTAGTMAAITAAERGADVILLEKAHVRHSGALAMGMDGVNNAVIPGKATPEDYVAEITRANDGVVNQRTVYQTATRGYDMVRRLERYGVKFEKNEHGEYAVRRVHRSGSYVLPMPEGKDVKKVLYRVLRRRDIREKVRIENRVMPVRVLTSEGRAVGVAGFDTRSGAFVTVAAGAVILATGACGRLGLPASGYLYGTYENPTNAGDGYAMAYHAGAELSGIECFQINPLIKDYNGPACAYVANPFGGYQVNAEGERFVDCDYWSGQMMAEVAGEIASARGPIYLKTSHLPDETLTALENILHTTERPTRGTFHAGRGHDYRTHDVEMHISEIGLCGGHSASVGGGAGRPRDRRGGVARRRGRHLPAVELAAVCQDEDHRGDGGRPLPAGTPRTAISRRAARRGRRPCRYAVRYSSQYPDRVAAHRLTSRCDQRVRDTSPPRRAIRA